VDKLMYTHVNTRLVIEVNKVDYKGSNVDWLNDDDLRSDSE